MIGELSATAQMIARYKRGDDKLSSDLSEDKNFDQVLSLLRSVTLDDIQRRGVKEFMGGTMSKFFKTLKDDGPLSMMSYMPPR